jgi:hypothetical protein
MAGAAMPDKSATLNEIARAYNRLNERFGGVTAIAPPTMTVLTSHLNAPNIYRNIPAIQAFTLLAASLSDSQRRALASEDGLGMNDLNTDQQRGLFRAVLPDQEFQVIPRSTPGHATPGSEIRDISSQQLANARLRVGVGMTMAVATVDHDSRMLSPKLGSGGSAPIYELMRGNLQFEQDAVDGVRVRDEQTNHPKKGNLNYEASALQKAVPLKGVKTVGDLIARIASVTGVEIYADRRFEHRTVTLMSDRPVSQARDLLMALAFCVTGAYRRVATDTAAAFVLTDDVDGVGARRERIRELEADSDATRARFLVEAEDFLQKEATLRSLPLNWFGNPLTLTPEQQKGGNRDRLGAASIGSLTLSPDHLTGPQREALNQLGEQLHQEATTNPQLSLGELDVDKPVTLFLQPSIQMLVPGLAGPVDTDLGQWVTTLFQDVPRFRPQSRPSAPSAGPQGSLKELAAGITHRALLAHPRTTEQVDALIGRMKTMQLNELWIDLDSQPPVPASGAGADKNPPDLLAWALKGTVGTDIAVYPIFNLFDGRADTPRRLRDLTILGETSTQPADRAQRRAMLMEGVDNPAPPSGLDSRSAVSPFSPEVQSLLSARIKSVASTAGIAGMVWCGIDLTGYSIPKNSMQLSPYGQLGYTPAARLAFLRKAHTDPLDITSQSDVRALFERANMSLPLFDDYVIDRQLREEWNAFRAEWLRTCLRGIHAAAANGASKITPNIFMRPLHDVSGVTWYGTWDSADAPVPFHHTENEARADDGSLPGVAAEDKQAKAQSNVALVRLPITSATMDEAAIVRQWGQAFQDVAKFHLWDGFVLDARE